MHRRAILTTFWMRIDMYWTNTVRVLQASGINSLVDMLTSLGATEQEEIIAKLRRKVKKTNERSTIVLQGLVAVSGVMCVHNFFT